MDIIEGRKKMAKVLNRAKKNAKPDYCILCGEPQTSFCNSHLIPQMVLKNIAEDGKLLHPNILAEIEVIDMEKGINNAGTFHFICPKCDGMFFQHYEDKDTIKNYPTDLIMAEIAVKNMLLMISKRNEEKALYNVIQSDFNSIINKELLDSIQNLDVGEYMDELNMYKGLITDKTKGCFKVMYWKKLPYVVPIAVQTPIAVYKDMNGDIINELYNMDPNYHIQNLHLCIFPMEDETIVLLFRHRRDKFYRGLGHQLNSCSEDKCLMFINYLVFAYTENYFCSEEIRNVLESNENLKKLFKEENGSPNFGYKEVYDLFGEEYTTVKMEEIPNFLSEQFKLR